MIFIKIVKDVNKSHFYEYNYNAKAKINKKRKVCFGHFKFSKK